MTKSADQVTLPVKPIGQLPINDQMNTDYTDDTSLDIWIDEVFKADEKRQAINEWRARNTIAYHAGNKNRAKVTVLSLSQLDIATLPASVNNDFDHVFHVTVTITKGDSVRVKVLVITQR
jgi:hypothetical protein